MTPRPPTSTLFPYTTLFRSLKLGEDQLLRDRILHRQESTRCQAGQTPSGLLRSEEHTSELQSRFDLVCRLLLEKKKKLTSLADVAYCAIQSPRHYDPYFHPL